MKPCGLRLHHIGRGDNALFETKVGTAKVLVGLIDIDGGHLQLAAGLDGFKTALVYLQLYLLAYLVQLELSDAGGSLAGLYFIFALKPVPYRHAHHDAHIPYARKLALEAVIEVGVGH